MNALRITKLQNRRQWAVRPADSTHNGRDSVIGYVKCRSYFNPTLEFHPVGYGYGVNRSYTAAQLKELGDFIAAQQQVVAQAAA